MWHARPLDDADIAAVVAMVNQCESADSGEVMLEAADLVSDLAGLDRQRDAVVVVSGGRIVGWAMVWQTRKRWADVHPDARGHGIGEWLLKWSTWRATALGADRIGQTIDDRRTEVAAWLAGHGYTPRYHSWILSAPADAAEHRAEPVAPGEVDAVLDLFERTFAEHQDRLPAPCAQWRAATVERPGFEPDDLLVIRVGDRPAAAAFLIDSGEVWVDKLAVAPEFRGHGFARDLLDAARSRATGRGYSHVRLSTDSNAGALEVYTRLGMSVERSFTHWAVDL
ncbi:MAG: GNAT family N-acetyltransferase [Micrococcales bacterium]|nr:GNAT family N-acetyltransferase [Micrococcales bacterium]